MDQQMYSQMILEGVTSTIPRNQKKSRRWELFYNRLERKLAPLITLLYELYGSSVDFNEFLKDLVIEMWQGVKERPRYLINLDRKREEDPHWYTGQDIVGGIIYVDLFAGSLQGVIDHIPYFKELGINYIHLMPLYKTPIHENDGGYAVENYREVNPAIGTMDDLREAARKFNKNGISLVLDFILNHTSDQHDWAKRARHGDAYYENFYFIFDNRLEVDEYNRHLRDIFPESREGSFSYREDIRKWVWTTFNSYQWDLNYRNHEVFKAMAREMLFLANAGTEVLRFDAIAFVWKEKGTRCESLPKAHTVIKAFKAFAAIVAPAMEFKSEAIVHPDEVIQYVGKDECALSYNPLLMATSWEALATRDPKLLRQSIYHRYVLPEATSWVNYVRCHDDIGWTFDDGDAESLGINGYFHRKFLNEFYTGRFLGSFARGLPFQENEKTGDCRISGTCASLAGLEKGVVLQDEQEITFALNKITLLYGLIFTLGGIPLIYMGDEIGLLNDYAYSRDSAKHTDSRWVHRAQMDWEKAERRKLPGTIEERLFSRFRKMTEMRKSESAFSMGTVRIIDHEHDHILGFARHAELYAMIVLANFSDNVQTMTKNDLQLMGYGYIFRDILTDRIFQDEIVLEPWEIVWLKQELDYAGKLEIS
ncbi:MAG: alpha-amylase family protein [Spirochaetales bacterium]|nr:alpha-amylase family protein [Spirochaetales bacterium]